MPPKRPSEALGRILLAYVQKQISADATAKALIDELERTGARINLEMDADLRAAVEREWRARDLK